jgi:glyoxylase-like metal-dependent hydrolase (beta-lactamase superfamily II)
MSIRLFALPCGWLEADLGLFLEGEAGKIRVPVPSWLVLHPAGALVFDTGLHIDTQTDAEGRLGFLARLYRIHFERGQELGARLRALGVDPARVPWLVNSHLHFDHVGGNAQLPNATLVVQRREWEAAADPDLRAKNYYDPRDYDLGHARRLVDGEHDVFGDGAVRCVPTPGHTPGHQSLRVRLPSGDVVLTADACYLRRALDAMQLPPVVHDRDEMLASYGRLRALEAAGARLYFGHDPAPWEQDPQAALEMV